MLLGGEDMKIKHDKIGVELTDKDSKNLSEFLEYWINLSEEDKNKLRNLILCGMGITTYFTIIYTLIRRRET